ncbi:MAG: hypothetical protein NWE95_00475 [Candidatus Bathyarchaeota archaeon]|nr:hypothetical protein [Candidatus Bathyarchaeota archaeon]
MLFGVSLAEVENRLCDNIKKTKTIFPEETRLIESGIDLMFKLTTISKDVCKEYPSQPNLYTNHNLFVRNRQLLLQAYISCLSSCYGSEFVILRTVLENNNLMRLFNKKPEYAFDWLPKALQKRFTIDAQTKYGKSGKHDETYNPFPVVGLVYDGKARKKVKSDVNKLYGQLCNYSHPNFMGWQELVRQQGEVEMIERLPVFSPINGEKSVGLLLFLMQLTFKSYVETFKMNLLAFSTDLHSWQQQNKKLLAKLTPEG